MAFITREEAPIKHTSGGEMPDVTQKSNVSPDDLESFGGFEEAPRGYLPIALSLIGFGISGFFFYRYFRRREETVNQTP